MKLIGFDEIKADLEKNFVAGQLHHALMLCGKKGVGKAIFAKDFALKCLIQDEKNHPDLLLVEKIEGKKNIAVDQIRKISNFFSKSSSFGAAKFVIIDAADDFNRSSANALLKILEEPNQNCFLILICHSIAKIMPTIASRCQRVIIKDFSFEEFQKAIKLSRPSILPALPDEEIRLLSQICDNSVAKALKNGDDLIFLYENWLNSLQNGILNKELLQKIADKKSDFADFTQMIEFFLGRLVKFYMGAIEYFLFNENEVFQDLKAKFDIEKIFLLQKKFEKRLERTIAVNLDKKLTAVNIFNQL